MYLILEYGDIIRDYCGDYRILIIQQNNCTATKVNRCSFAGKLTKKLLYSNPYRDGKSGPFPTFARINDHPIPSSICLKYGNGVKNPVVCYCFAQYKMGNGLVPYYMDSPKTDSTYEKTPDNSKTRLKNFARCLNKLLSEFKNNTRLNNIHTIIVPGYIGCNRGGGVWSFYRSELIKFVHELASIKPNIKMNIVYFKQNKSSDISKFIYYTMIIFFFIIFLKIEHVNNYLFIFYRFLDAVQKRCAKTE